MIFELVLLTFIASLCLVDCAAFKKPRVIVVGCGISGLELMKQLVTSDKFDVIGLEARDRVGGRVFTTEKGHEIGAAWIHGTHMYDPDGSLVVEENPVFTMAKEFIPPEEFFLNSNFHAVNSDGSKLPNTVEIWDQLWITLNQIKTSQEARVNAFQPSNTSIYDFISSNWEQLLSHVEPGTVEAFIKFLIEWQGYYACNWETTSIGSMAVDKEFTGDQLLITNGGYTRLLKRYLDKYGLEQFIRLNKPVTEIHKREDGCTVVTLDSNGHSEVFEADVVVVTVPLGVLKAKGIIFDPPLPQEKLDSINRLGFGLYDKIFIEFAAPIETDKGGFWLSDIEVIFIVPKADDDIRDYRRAIAHGQSIEGDDGSSPRRPYDDRDPGHIGIEMSNLSSICHCPKLVMLIYEKAAREMEEIAHDPVLLTEFARSKLQNAFPDSFIPEIVNVEATKWGMDPYAYGSYANIPLGASGQDMHTLSLPVDGKILFAGEATFSLHYSTVHGAMKSGRREFARLMNMFYPHEENEFLNLL